MQSHAFVFYVFRVTQQSKEVKVRIWRFWVMLPEACLTANL